MGKCIWQSALFVIALMLPPRVSNAQQADSQAIAAAQSLVDEASELMDANKFADACPKLEQAAKLVPTGVGAKLALAECYEGLGRLASAQGQYLQAEALARAAKDPRAKEAASKAVQLKAKLATMTLKIPEALRNLEGVSLTWDSLELDPAIWGTPIPVDVGKHAIEVKAPGWRSWKEDVTIDADGRAFEQEVPMLEKLPEEKPSPIVPVKPTTPTSTWMRPVGIAISSVGVASLVAGSALGALAIARFDASNAEGKCDANNLCNATGVSLRSESLAFARGSTVMIPVGIAFAGGGVALLIASMASKKKDSSETAADIQWQFEAAPGGIGFRGVW